MTIETLIKLTKGTNILGNVTNSDELYNLLRPELSVFCAFTFKNKKRVINDSTSFDSGNNIFWQMSASDEIEINTRRQKIGLFDFQVTIWTSNELIKFQGNPLPTRYNKNHKIDYKRYIYLVLFPINILIPDNVDIKLKSGQRIKMYSKDCSMSISQTDNTMILLNDIPKMFRKKFDKVITNMIVKIVMDDNEVNSVRSARDIYEMVDYIDLKNCPMLSHIFNFNVFAISKFKNLEFLLSEKRDISIMMKYGTEAETIIKNIISNNSSI